MADEPFATDTFSMDCPTCGPGTVQFLAGEMVPHGCDYVPPSLVIDCQGDSVTDPRSRNRVRAFVANFAAAATIGILLLVVLTPPALLLLFVWRWAL